MTMLAQLDMSVRHVRSADEALKAMAETPVDCVLSDINLGSKHTGVWLYNQLVLRYPNLPVILMSGMPRETLISDFGLHPDWPLMTKPVSRLIYYTP